jgi:hypothetical protein
LSAKRVVAQLDFYDSISSAELSADRINAGNWTWCRSRPGSFAWSNTRFGDGVAKLDVGYDLVNDPRIAS